MKNGWLSTRALIVWGSLIKFRVNTHVHMHMQNYGTSMPLFPLLYASAQDLDTFRNTVYIHEGKRENKKA